MVLNEFKRIIQFLFPLKTENQRLIQGGIEVN